MALSAGNFRKTRVRLRRTRVFRKFPASQGTAFGRPLHPRQALRARGPNPPLRLAPNSQWVSHFFAAPPTVHRHHVIRGHVTRFQKHLVPEGARCSAQLHANPERNSLERAPYLHLTPSWTPFCVTRLCTGWPPRYADTRSPSALTARSPLRPGDPRAFKSVLSMDSTIRKYVYFRLLQRTRRNSEAGGPFEEKCKLSYFFAHAKISGRWIRNQPISQAVAGA